MHILNLIHIRIDKKIGISIYQLLEPLSKLKLTKFYIIQLLRAAISWRDLKTIGAEEADLKE